MSDGWMDRDVNMTTEAQRHKKNMKIILIEELERRK